jgi:hypothetical protein
MGNLLDTVHLADVVERLDIWGQTAMKAEDLRNRKWILRISAERECIMRINKKRAHAVIKRITIEEHAISNAVQYLVLDHARQREIVEQLCEVHPHSGTCVFAEALVVETVNLHVSSHR